MKKFENGFVQGRFEMSVLILAFHRGDAVCIGCGSCCGLDGPGLAKKMEFWNSFYH